MSFETLFIDYLQKLINIFINCLTQSFQQIVGWTPNAHCNEASCRVEMQIIPPTNTFSSSSGSDKGAIMSFVRCFVGRKTSVAVNSENTVACIEVPHLFIKTSDFSNQFSCQLFKHRFGLFVAMFVFSKPFAIVIFA